MFTSINFICFNKKFRYTIRHYFGAFIVWFRHLNSAFLVLHLNTGCPGFLCPINWKFEICQNIFLSQFDKNDTGQPVLKEGVGWLFFVAPEAQVLLCISHSFRCKLVWPQPQQQVPRTFSTTPSKNYPKEFRWFHANLTTSSSKFTLH